MLNMVSLIGAIRYYAKKRNIRISELELGMGASVGYLSRVAKLDDIGIMKVLRICEILQVPIEKLISTEIVKEELKSEYKSFVEKCNNAGVSLDDLK